MAARRGAAVTRKRQYQYLDERLTIACSEVWKERLRDYSAAHGLDMADVVRDAVWEWLDSKEREGRE
jgi:hypothetical protein